MGSGACAGQPRPAARRSRPQPTSGNWLAFLPSWQKVRCLWAHWCLVQLPPGLVAARGWRSRPRPREWGTSCCYASAPQSPSLISLHEPRAGLDSVPGRWGATTGRVALHLPARTRLPVAGPPPANSRRPRSTHQGFLRAPGPCFWLDLLELDGSAEGASTGGSGTWPGRVKADQRRLRRPRAPRALPSAQRSEWVADACFVRRRAAAAGGPRHRALVSERSPLRGAFPLRARALAELTPEAPRNATCETAIAGRASPAGSASTTASSRTSSCSGTACGWYFVEGLGGAQFCPGRSNVCGACRRPTVVPFAQLVVRANPWGDLFLAHEGQRRPALAPPGPT